MSDEPIVHTSKRVLLTFPVFHSVLPAAFQNFLRLTLQAVQYCSPQYVFDPIVIPRSSIHGAMNTAVETALLHGHEYLIAFDDDCIPEISEFAVGDKRRWQVIPRLLALGDAGHPIVTGVGYMRGYPHTTTVGRKYKEGAAFVLGKQIEEDSLKGFFWVDDLSKHEAERDEHGLLDVDFCGVPIICIHRSVLEKLPQPLFQTKEDGGGGCTHDVFFCNLAKQHGFAIKVDTHIDCGHIVEGPIINKLTRATARSAAESLYGTHDRGSSRDEHDAEHHWDGGQVCDRAAVPSGAARPGPLHLPERDDAESRLSLDRG